MNKTKINSAFDLTGQTALITGGGTGLGLGMARCLVESGAKVVLVGRRQEELEKACATLGKNSFALVGDVTKLETAPKIIDEAEKLAGPVSILINNAGVHLKKPTVETSDAEFAAVIQTHIFRRVRTDAGEAGRRMVERKSGSVLFTASMASLMGIPLDRRLFGGEVCLRRHGALARDRMGSARRACERHRARLDRVGQYALYDKALSGDAACARRKSLAAMADE